MAKTRVRKSPHLQVLVSREKGRVIVKDLIWPNERPFEPWTNDEVIVFSSLKESEQRVQLDIFFAILRAADLHGSEEMRTALKAVIEASLNKSNELLWEN